jgi:hypothetical protein
MKIDIEKLNRKTPYPEPSDEFFKMIQDNVISKTIGEQTQTLLKKEAKVFSLNFKWMAAAAVVFIAGIMAFLELNNNSETESFASQNAIVDSVYNIDQPKLSNSPEQIANNTVAEKPHTDLVKVNNTKNHHIASANSKVRALGNKSFDNIDRQEYIVEKTKRRSESEVEKVLVAFTPDQLKDLDRNSEQDVYLDLYN